MMTDSEIIQHLKDALERIAQHTGSDPDGTYDEWTEAGAFSECQEIARQALETVSSKTAGSER